MVSRFSVGGNRSSLGIGEFRLLRRRSLPPLPPSPPEHDERVLEVLYFFRKIWRFVNRERKKKKEKEEIANIVRPRFFHHRPVAIESKTKE